PSLRRAACMPTCTGVSSWRKKLPAPDEVLGKAYDARLMRRLLAYLRGHLPAVSIAFVAIVAGSLVELAQPWLTQQAIDRYIATNDVAGLGRITVVFLGLLVLGFVLEFV